MTALITREGLAVLDAALAWIDEHPEQHYQGSWIKRTPACGTTYCLAGAIVMLSGAEPLWTGTLGGVADYADDVVLTDGQRTGIGQRAADLLGLDYGSGVIDDLFLSSADRQDLAVLRDELAASLDGAS